MNSNDNQLLNNQNQLKKHQYNECLKWLKITIKILVIVSIMMIILYIINYICDGLFDSCVDKYYPKHNTEEDTCMFGVFCYDKCWPLFYSGFVIVYALSAFAYIFAFLPGTIITSLYFAFKALTYKE